MNENLNFCSDLFSKIGPRSQNVDKKLRPRSVVVDNERSTCVFSFHHRYEFLAWVALLSVCSMWFCRLYLCYQQSSLNRSCTNNAKWMGKYIFRLCTETSTFVMTMCVFPMIRFSVVKWMWNLPLQTQTQTPTSTRCRCQMRTKYRRTGRKVRWKPAEFSIFGLC